MEKIPFYPVRGVSGPSLFKKFIPFNWEIHDLQSLLIEDFDGKFDAVVLPHACESSVM